MMPESSTTLELPAPAPVRSSDLLGRVLIGCEYSASVRNEFDYLRWDAWSCDLLPSEKGGKHHQCDIFEAVTHRGPWDIIILHPPCTAMSLSGNRHYGRGKPKHTERVRALLWTERLVERARKYAPCVVVEQPSSVLCRVLGKRHQEINPWQFGHMEQKKTWLWIYGLPKLNPTNNVHAAMMTLPKKQRERIHHMTPSPTRGKERSLTYSGIAKAMAYQWTLATRPNSDYTKKR